MQFQRSRKRRNSFSLRFAIWFIFIIQVYTSTIILVYVMYVCMNSFYFDIAFNFHEHFLHIANNAIRIQ